MENKIISGSMFDSIPKPDITKLKKQSNKHDNFKEDSENMSLEKARQLVAKANGCVMSKYLSHIDCLKDRNKLYR